MQVVRGLLIDAVRGYIHYYLYNHVWQKDRSDERWTLATFCFSGSDGKGFIPHRELDPSFGG